MWEDPAQHIGPEFRQHFPTWHELYRYLQNEATAPEYGPDRALHQVLSADFAQRLVAAGDHSWVMLGSLSWPGRTTSGTWPRDFLPSTRSSIDPAYRVARSAFDLDMCAVDLAHPDPEEEGRTYGPTIAAMIAGITTRDGGAIDARSLGLGGLVRYTVEANIATYPNVMGVITAQPIDPRYGPHRTVPVDDPIAVNIDIKPPRKVAPTVPIEASARPAVALTVPGMAPYLPALYPTVNQLADKVTPLVGPPHALRPTPGGPWHRYKDLFDVVYLLKTCEISAEAMRKALNVNWNMDRLGITELPRPYRLYGSYGHGPTIPWAEACDSMMRNQPELRAYPDFPAMSRLVADFADGLATAPLGSRWQPEQGWRLELPTTDPTVEQARSAARSAARSFPQSAQQRLGSSNKPSQGDQTSSRLPSTSNRMSSPEVGE